MVEQNKNTIGWSYKERLIGGGMKLIRSCTFAAILNTTNRISASTLRYSTTNKFSSRMLSISRVKVEDISFISADIAKLIDEDLMFKQGSKKIFKY